MGVGEVRERWWWLGAGGGRGRGERRGDFGWVWRLELIGFVNRSVEGGERRRNRE